MEFKGKISSDDIHLFLEVMRLGSFSAAAGRLGQTPSAVSRGISRLEDKLATQLVHRTTRQLVPTDEGATLLAEGPRVIDVLDDLDSGLRNRQGRISGTLRVSVGTTIAQTMITPALPSFLSQHPELVIDLCVTDRRVDLVRERIDVAIRTGPVQNTQLTAHHLFTAYHAIVASPEYLKRNGTPAQPEDLLGHRCLALTGPENYETWSFRRTNGVETMHVPSDLRSDSALALRDLVIAGLGIARLADFVIRDARNRGDVAEILNCYHSATAFPVSAVHPTVVRRSARLRKFLEFLADDVFGSSFMSAS